MFISHWLQRTGITEVCAPIHPSNKDKTGDDETNLINDNNVHGEDAINAEESTADATYGEETPIFDFLAPRPKSSSKQNGSNGVSIPPAGAFTSKSSSSLDFVKCQHCHKMTPVVDSQRAATQNEQLCDENADDDEDDFNVDDFDNPFSPESKGQNIEQTQIIAQVTSAAIDTSLTQNAPSSEYEAIFKAFQQATWNSNNEKGLAKILTRLEKNLKKNPALVPSRSFGFQGMVPDGFTLLHAACHSGHVKIVEFLLENYVAIGDDGGGARIGVDVEKGEENGEMVANADGKLGDDQEADDKSLIDLNERDVLGRTPLHIAAEKGRIEVILLLRKAYDTLQTQLAETTDNDAAGSSDDDDTNSQNNITTTTSIGTQTDSQKTPLKALSPKRGKAPKSISPKPHTSNKSRKALSPTFAGPSAPVDLAGRTPFAHAFTSNDDSAKKNRTQLKNILYIPGDKSVVGERTPPRERCGGGGKYGIFSPMTKSGGRSGRKCRVSFGKGDCDGILSSGATSYLSPTPGRKIRRFYTPGGSSNVGSSSKKCPTPFFSPLTSGAAQKEGLRNSTANDVREDRNSIIPLLFGASELSGFRITMEDAMCCHYPLTVPSIPPELNGQTISVVPTIGLFGVFDGHGGASSSKFVAHNLLSQMESHPKWSWAYYGCNSDNVNNSSNDVTLSTILTDTCYALDEKLKDSMDSKNSGTTAIIAVVSDRKIFVANVGDSRCIIVKKREGVAKSSMDDGGTDEPNLVEEDHCKSGSAESITNSDATKINSENEATPWDTSVLEIVALSDDHKPNLPEERARIESAGLTVKTDTVMEDDGRITSIHRIERSKTESLGVARAFGDFDYKKNKDLSPSRQAIVCTPDILVRDRKDAEDMYLVLACDGIWDVMSNEEVGSFVARRVEERRGQESILASVGDDLCDECLRKESQDNMSVLIVALPASGLCGAMDDVAAVREDGAARALEFE
mmetsp:Transcript_25774/g.54230  ORF Transcript_25774/g.54230 Transcript_25774/m.54230 type:complete len:967 (-) Transcript_25774:17-2917(-)